MRFGEGKSAIQSHTLGIEEYSLNQGLKKNEKVWKKELLDFFKKYGFIDNNLSGKVVVNLNQGGITCVEIIPAARIIKN